MTALLVRRPQNRGRVDGCDDGDSACGNYFSSGLSHLKVAAEQCLGGGGPKADNDLRPHRIYFFIEPRSTGGDFSGAGFFVNSTLAPRLPFEMFYRICEINICAIDPRRPKSPIQDFPRRAHKRTSLKIFVIAGLFPDHHDLPTRLAFTKDRLRPAHPQVTAAAALGCLTEGLKCPALGQKVGSRDLQLFCHQSL